MNAHRVVLAAALAASLLAPAASAFQAPEYRAEFLGPGVVVNDMNAAGQVVGWTTAGTVPGVQAYLADADGFELLPLPDGYASAWAQGVNDAGVVVGSAAQGSFPEFGQAVAWFPDGQGGRTPQLLGQLPGSTQSVAYDVNNRGDIVGVSLTPGFQGGPTTWFNAPTGLVDLSALGAPGSPKEVNDDGLVVGINGGLFDLDTLAPLPLPAFPAGQSGFQGWAINALGELTGKGFYGSQRAAAVWSLGGGWQAISLMFGQSALVQGFDINAAGITVAEIPQPAAYFPGAGVFVLEQLLTGSQQGEWDFAISLGGAVNDAGQIAAVGVHLPSGDTGVVLLTPLAPPFADLGQALAGAAGEPALVGKGTLLPGTGGSLVVADGAPLATAFLVLSTQRIDAPFKGGVLVPAPDVLLPVGLDAEGLGMRSFTWPTGVPSGAELFAQAWIPDAGALLGFAATNAVGLSAP